MHFLVSHIFNHFKEGGHWFPLFLLFEHSLLFESPLVRDVCLNYRACTWRHTAFSEELSRPAILFLCISIVKETEMVQVGSSIKHSLNSCWNKRNKGRDDIIFLFSHFSFWCHKKMKPFWGTTKKCENKN